MLGADCRTGLLASLKQDWTEEKKGINKKWDYGEKKNRGISEEVLKKPQSEKTVTKNRKKKKIQKLI